MNLFENLQTLKEFDKSVKVSNKNYKRTLKEINDVISNIYQKELIPKQCNEIIEDIYYKVVELKNMFNTELENKSIKEDIKNEMLSESVDTIDDIKYLVTCQLVTGNDEVYSEHYTLKDAIASARKAQQSFFNVKIKDLSDGLSWLDIDDAEQDLKNEEQKSQ